MPKDLIEILEILDNSTRLSRAEKMLVEYGKELCPELDEEQIKKRVEALFEEK